VFHLYKVVLAAEKESAFRIMYFLSGYNFHMECGVEY